MKLFKTVVVLDYMDNTKKISIIIPVYNEKRTILEVIKRVEESDTLGLEKEVVLVDDGSTDGTKDVLKRLENKYLIIYHPKNLGKGAALRSGFQAAKGDIILMQDSDLELNPHDYPQLLKPVLEQKSDVISGNRYSGDNPRFYFMHYYGGKLLSWLTNLFYGSKLSDICCGYKVFESSVLKNLDLKSNGFEIEEELTIKILKRGYKILEVPIAYHPRTYQEGKKTRWHDGLKAIWLIIKYKFVN